MLTREDETENFLLRLLIFAKERLDAQHYLLTHFGVPVSPYTALTYEVILKEFSKTQEGKPPSPYLYHKEVK